MPQENKDAIFLIRINYKVQKAEGKKLLNEAAQIKDQGFVKKLSNSKPGNIER